METLIQGRLHSPREPGPWEDMNVSCPTCHGQWRLDGWERDVLTRGGSVAPSFVWPCVTPGCGERHNVTPKRSDRTAALAAGGTNGS